jgi:putative hydrolase of the HAD superfamily
LLSSLDLDDHFEVVTYSAAERVEKPHPAIFDAALRALDVDPFRAFHIGDRLEEDYVGAREAGLRALLVCREPAGPEVMDEVKRWGHERDLVADLAAAAERILG